MNKLFTFGLSLLLGLASHAALSADEPASLSAADRKAVIDVLATKLRANYVFPDVAERLATTLIKKNAKGDYAASNNVASFAQALSQDLRELGKDGHFRVNFDPDFRASSNEGNAVPSADEMARERQMLARMAFGIQRVEQMPGNVGYLELRGFGPASVVSAAYTAALTLLQGSDALIIDLRRNGGGEPDSVAHFMSYFFAEGDRRHLNDLYFRPQNETQQFWTEPSVTLRYNKLVYVLTAPRTFSAGEECAYNFQTQKRATLIGETTGGGANPGEEFGLAHGLVAFIPTGRAINPITKTNWEHVGVIPDIKVTAADALQTAHVTALKQLLQNSSDAEQREALEFTLAKVEKGEVAKPVYQMRQ